MSDRDDRQARIFEWARSTFGEANIGPHERLRRFIEEAVELAQAGGLTREQIEAIVQHVYAKPPGVPQQEAGGVGVTLLAYCQAMGFSADASESAEVERVLAIDPAYFRRRHDMKAEAGIASPTDWKDNAVG
jgi:hypothetical protein